MTRPLSQQEHAEVSRRLVDGAAVSRISRDMALPITVVRRVRDDLRIPARRPGNDQVARPEPVRWGDTDEVDGDPADANPHRIPVGVWCMERPRCREWQALVDAAGDIERVTLRHCMAAVHGLPLGTSDESLEHAVRADRRLAEELAGLYLKARGYGR